MKLIIGKRGTFTVGSFEEASMSYSRIRHESKEGASTFPAGVLIEEDPISGWITKYGVSYNGRIWNGNVLIYDNR